MSSAVVCDYAGSVWELNSQNENPCQVYAQLQGKCDPTFVVSGANLTFSPPPYQAPNNACGCNLVAYNLMGGCSWCQNSRGFSWLTVNQWAADCTTTQYNPSGISASVSTVGIDIPTWAYITPTSGTWSPAQASLVATSPNSTPYTGYPVTDENYNYRAEINASVVLYILRWILLAILVCGVVIGFVVHYRRQTRRRALYMPTAAYHLAQRVGYAGVYGRFPYAPPGAVGATAPIGYAPHPHPPTGHPAGYVPSTAPAMANYRPGSTVTAGFQPAEHTTTSTLPEPRPESNYQAVPGSPVTPGSCAGALGLTVPSTPVLDSAQPPAPSMPVASGSKGAGTYHAAEEMAVASGFKGVGTYYAAEEMAVDTAVYPVQEVPSDATGYPVEKATPSAANTTREKSG